MAPKLLLLLGSGPGIGLSTARTFSVRGFTHVALVSRNAARLEKDWDAVLDAIQERGYSCQVKKWACDLNDFERLGEVMREVVSWGREGSLECVVFNAARVGGKPVLEEGTEAMEGDFRTTNLALYEVAKYTIPLLRKKFSSDPDSSPSFFVTSTTQLYKEPIPDLVSLSMVKSAQRSLVLSLHGKYGDEVHVALLSVGGVVAPEKASLSPENIANKCWELYKQPRGGWEREMEIHE